MSSINPQHYKAGSLQAIDCIEAFKLNFLLGNALKYILRAGKKGDKSEDLQKAIWYLQRQLSVLDSCPNERQNEITDTSRTSTGDTSAVPVG